MSTVIQVDSLWKKYRLGVIGTGTLAHDLNRWWHRVRGKPDPYLKIGAQEKQKAQSRKQTTEGQGAGDFSVSALQPVSISEPPSELGDDETWALRDINFEVKQGEILGIIGRNGAGKSTLLKILSRVTAPTHGQMRVKGRIASLLEVGTGFHPELTGRENIFLNGAILGMTKAEIKSKLDEIIAFAEIEKYIDTPVKRYSSGMYVRLAFAVAAHLEPEILIVDEVLAVGDASFQKKCLGKMQDIAGHGRTVLFVSHNMVAVQSLCHRGLLLQGGGLVYSGVSRDVIRRYLGSGSGPMPVRRWTDLTAAPGNEVIKIISISVKPSGDGPDVVFTMETPVVIEVEAVRMKPDKVVHLTFHLLNEDEVTVLTTSPGLCPAATGCYRSSTTIPGNFLNSGAYRLRLLVVEDRSRVVYTEDSIASFAIQEMQARSGGWMGKEPGAVRVKLNWELAMQAT